MLIAVNWAPRVFRGFAKMEGMFGTMRSWVRMGNFLAIYKGVILMSLL